MPYEKLVDEEDAQMNNARASSALNPYSVPYTQPTATNFAPLYSHSVHQPQQPTEQELQYYSPQQQNNTFFNQYGLNNQGVGYIPSDTKTASIPMQNNSFHVPQPGSTVYPATNISDVPVTQASILPVQVQSTNASTSASSYFAPENHAFICFLVGLITGIIGFFFLPFFFISLVALMIGFFNYRKHQLASNRTNARRCLYALLAFVFIRLILFVISIVFLVLTGGGMIGTIISIITSVTKQ